MTRLTRSLAIPAAVLFAVIALVFSPIAAQAATASRGVSPNDYTGPVVNAHLDYDGTTLSATGTTNAWTRGTITISAELWNGIELYWSYTNKCYNSTSCTIPTIFQICPAPGQVWQLYVYAYGPSTSGHTDVSDAKTVVT